MQAAQSSSGSQRALWLGGGALLLSILPYTSLAMMPLNHAIIAAGQRGEAAKEGALQAWGPLHNVRTALAVAAAGLMAYALYTL